jgi:hypothetical protein
MYSTKFENCFKHGDKLVYETDFIKMRDPLGQKYSILVVLNHIFDILSHDQGVQDFLLKKVTSILNGIRPIFKLFQI